MRLLLLLVFSTQAFGAPVRHSLGGGLDRYSRLVMSDAGTKPRNGVRVTYLGTNGYQFKFNGHALLVDPYFSRLDLLSIALGLRIQPARPGLTMDWVISREERMRFW